MTREQRIVELEAELAKLKAQKPEPYLAWVSDKNSKTSSRRKSILRRIVEVYDDCEFPFQDDFGAGWVYATPLTRQEVLDFLPEPTSKYDWDAILEEYPWATAVALHPDSSIVICNGQELLPRITAYTGDFSKCNVINNKPEWILEKTKDWTDSIEYKQDVFPE